MIDRDKEQRPEHSVEPEHERPTGHEVDPPAERTDDEVGSDEEKTIKRQE